MSESSGKEYRLSSAQVSSNVADEVVILNHDKGVYYGLGEVGAAVWSALESGPKTFDELCTLVTEEYEVDSTTCEADVSALLDELVREKLVETDA
ncbi:PqqD family protein [Persicitalea sp.]|uniref:PqqD family protein n=1 Tax=Persicitalea sp. TaxID=3100273 RepID=UPI003593C1E3